MAYCAAGVRAQSAVDLLLSEAGLRMRVDGRMKGLALTVTSIPKGPKYLTIG